jgi:hypothetical protein
LYLQRSAACHAEDRSGTGRPRWNDDGEVNGARDFTAGYLKGGSMRRDIAHRIRAGMPGSAMPATHLENPADLAALVEHVMALSPGSKLRTSDCAARK